MTMKLAEAMEPWDPLATDKKLDILFARDNILM